MGRARARSLAYDGAVECCALLLSTSQKRNDVDCP